MENLNFIALALPFQLCVCDLCVSVFVPLKHDRNGLGRKERWLHNWTFTNTNRFCGWLGRVGCALDDIDLCAFGGLLDVRAAVWTRVKYETCLLCFSFECFLRFLFLLVCISFLHAWFIAFKWPFRKAGKKLNRRCVSSHGNFLFVLILLILNNCGARVWRCDIFTVIARINRFLANGN